MGGTCRGYRTATTRGRDGWGVSVKVAARAMGVRRPWRAVVASGWRDVMQRGQNAERLAAWSTPGDPDRPAGRGQRPVR